MNRIRIAAPVAALVAALLVLPARADTDAQGELDADGLNHYILKCDAICPKIVAAGAIGPAFTGAWFDPKQSGHGLFIEVLPDNRIQALWFTFNPAGTEQAWFVGTGIYSANKASISAVVQPQGGQWIPNFDPSRVVASPWGTLNLAFTDCNHGVVQFVTKGGYGAGVMSLTRLTQPAGLSC